MTERSARLLMTADAVGGVWQYSTELAAGLSAHGVETVLAVLGPPPNGAQRQEAEALGITIIDTGLPLDWLSEAEPVLQAATALAELARKECVDVVHLNSPTLAAGQDFGVPVLGVPHGCLSTWWEAARSGPLAAPFQWHHEMMARGLRVCDRIVAPSASFAETLRRHYALPVPPVVVHNGRSVHPGEARLPLRDCAFTAGRLWDEVKNARLLDAVAARLPFPFHAAGPVRAPHGEAVKLEHLHMLGQLDGPVLARWLAARPVFVSAATFEPFGLAVLEAASAGCALVLSDLPTFRELWDGAALFVPPGDVDGFVEGTEECVQNLALREKLGLAARARAGRYSVQRMAGAMAAHYRELLAARMAA